MKIKLHPCRKTTINYAFQLLHTVLGTGAPKRAACPGPCVLVPDGFGPDEFGPY